MEDNSVIVIVYCSKNTDIGKIFVYISGYVQMMILFHYIVFYFLYYKQGI